MPAPAPARSPAPAPAPTPPCWRVLVADDHPVVRAGLVAMLAGEPDLAVVGQARDGEEAVAGWLAHAPDLGLIDLSMPGLDGFGAVAAIRRHTSNARLVVMTTMDGDGDVFRALQAGASGYLLKDCGRPELLACLRSVARGRKYLQPAAAARLAEHLSCTALTERETEVLHWLAQGQGNKHIARQLGIAQGTVKSHVRNLLAKLGVASRTQAARLALQRGLVHLPAAAAEV